MPSLRRSASISASGSACAGCGSAGGSVEQRLMTTTRVEVMARAEAGELGAGARDGGERLGAGLAEGDAGAHLALGGGELGGDGLGQAVGQHAAVDEARGAHGERRLDEVVAAEDEVVEGGQAGLGERRAHGHEARRRGESGGDRGRARDRRRGDGTTAPDDPHAGACGPSLHDRQLLSRTPSRDFSQSVNQSPPLSANEVARCRAARGSAPARASAAERRARPCRAPPLRRPAVSLCPSRGEAEETVS